MYKIVAKVLARRLKKVLNDIIGPYQMRLGMISGEGIESDLAMVVKLQSQLIDSYEFKSLLGPCE